VPVAAFLSYLLVPHAPLGMAGWRWVVLIGAHGALFIWWIRRALPESPVAGATGQTDRSRRDHDRLETQVEAEFGRPLPQPEAPQPVVPRGRMREMFAPPYRRRTIMMVIFNLLQTVGFYGFANWVPTLLIQQGISVTSSLLYASIIALAAPLGPLVGILIADRFERKHVLVAAALAVVLSGLAFSRAGSAVAIILIGAALTLENNIMSYTFHAYQQELYPTGIRARAVGFVYSWSRFSAIFTGFVIASF